MFRLIRMVFVLLILTPVVLFAQFKDSTAQFKISGYVDAYYARYSDSVGVGNFQKFAAEAPKSNQFGLNIMQLSAQYSSSMLRATATLHFGDLPSASWTPVYNMIQEANAGVKLGKSLWLDAGFFKTHIGTEALLPKDNIATSISVITLYEPWFQAGAKLTYNPNDKFLFCLHLLNGYNVFVDNNSRKSVGISAFYAFSDKVNIGYYNLIGNEMPDSIKSPHTRVLNNFVFNWQINPKLKLLAGFDYITQQHSQLADSSKTATVTSAIITLRYQLAKKLGAYGRFEYFQDPDGFLSGVIPPVIVDPSGYKLTGYTLGMEYKFTENSYLRLEGRQLDMDNTQKIFRTDGGQTNVRYEGILDFGIWF